MLVTLDDDVAIRRGDYRTDAACQMVIDELVSSGYEVTSQEWRPGSTVAWRTAFKLVGVRLTSDGLHIDTDQHRDHHVTYLEHAEPRQGVPPASWARCSCNARLKLAPGPKEKP